MNDEMLFSTLLLSLHAAGMQQLGKVMNPLTNKIERDLEQAQATIAMLEMLKAKTSDNLSEDESKLLSSLLYQLQMNYVEEAGEGEKPGTPEPEDSKNDDVDKQPES